MNPEKPDDEDLEPRFEQEDLYSAYLDGELSEKEAREFESRLAADPEERRKFQQTKQTWELLDYLPSPDLTSNFTARTMERLEQVSRTTRAQKKLRESLPQLALASGLLLVFVGGFLGMNTYLKDPLGELDLIRDIRVIDNLSLYEKVGTLDFLQRLNDPELFGEEIPSPQGQ